MVESPAAPSAPKPPQEPLLEVRDLAVNFSTSAGEVAAVRGVSFSMEAGEVRALVGESGSGKSVTARALARLLPPPPQARVEGSVRFAGRAIETLGRRELRALRGPGIGYVFQEPSAAINPSIRIGTQLLEVLRLHRARTEATRETALELLAQVGLRSPRQAFHAYPGELSGGMLQRVIIALAIAPRPRLLVADEPTTALDVTVERQIIDLLRRLQAELSLAVLLITHNFGIVQGFATRTEVMWQGQIVESGTSEAVLRTPQHPYTQALLKSRPQLGKPQSRLYTSFSLRQ
jgi:ABC-type dipeptide/oligopeptide/nickel transport system ATPase component